MAITYLLNIYLDKQKCIKVGKLGTFRFKNGYYVYVGSAKRNMAKRIARHLRKKKKKFWHIDYLLQYAEVKKVWTSDFPEERTAEFLAEKMTASVLGFGASDKKSKTHLFYCKSTITTNNIFLLLTAIGIPL